MAHGPWHMGCGPNWAISFGPVWCQFDNFLFVWGQHLKTRVGRYGPDGGPMAAMGLWTLYSPKLI